MEVKLHLNEVVFLFIAVLAFGGLASCIHRTEFKPPAPVTTETYQYWHPKPGQWIIVSTSDKARDEAIQHIHPGPVTMERLDVWIVENPK